MKLFSLIYKRVLKIFLVKLISGSQNIQLTFHLWRIVQIHYSRNGQTMLFIIKHPLGAPPSSKHLKIKRLKKIQVAPSLIGKSFNQSIYVHECKTIRLHGLAEVA